LPETFTDGSHLTEQGLALIAKLLASKGELVFTKATVGSGTVPEGMTPEEMTALAQYEMDGVITALENPGNGEASVTVQAFPLELEQGFFATEVGLFAMDPDEGEILYDYFTLAQKPEWIRPNADPVLKLATFTLVTIVSGVALVSAIINPHGLATIKYVDDSLRAHALAPLGPDVHPETYIWQLWIQQQIDNANSRPFEADLVGLSNGRINGGFFDPNNHALITMF